MSTQMDIILYKSLRLTKVIRCGVEKETHRKVVLGFQVPIPSVSNNTEKETKI